MFYCMLLFTSYLCVEFQNLSISTMAIHIVTEGLAWYYHSKCLRNQTSNELFPSHTQTFFKSFKHSIAYTVGLSLFKRIDFRLYRAV